MLDYLESDIHVWRSSSVVEEVIHALVGGLGRLGDVRRVGRDEHLLLLGVQEPIPGLLLVQHHTGTLKCKCVLASMHILLMSRSLVLSMHISLHLTLCYCL